MNKIFAFACLLAAASAAPAPDADPFLLAGAATPIAAPLAYANPTCRTEFEDIPTQSCIPKAVTKCNTQDVESENIEYEESCQDVESNICDGAPVASAIATPGAILVKRDADADPQLLLGTAGYATYGLPAVAPAVATKSITTVKHACHKVTTKHCVNNPVVKKISTPVETCHVVSEVECKEVMNKVPKTICEQQESQVVNTVISSPTLIGATAVNTPVILPGGIATGPILPAGAVVAVSEEEAAAADEPAAVTA